MELLDNSILNLALPASPAPGWLAHLAWCSTATATCRPL
jgi:hypothetical protein